MFVCKSLFYHLTGRRVLKERLRRVFLWKRLAILYFLYRSYSYFYLLLFFESLSRDLFKTVDLQCYPAFLESLLNTIISLNNREMNSFPLLLIRKVVKFIFLILKDLHICQFTTQCCKQSWKLRKYIVFSTKFTILVS